MKIIITDINIRTTTRNGLSARRKPQRPPYNILRVLRSPRVDNHRQYYVIRENDTHTHIHTALDRPCLLLLFIITIKDRGRLVFVCAGNYNLPINPNYYYEFGFV